MEDREPPIPRLSRQPLTVDFIDNRLPRYHPAFENTTARFDIVSRQYVQTTHDLSVTPPDAMVAVPEASGQRTDEKGLMSMDNVADTNVMKFWNAIFPEAMDRFKLTAEPRGRAQTQYSIRDKCDWDAVYLTLVEARAEYQNEEGRLGTLRELGRKIADSITPVAEVAKIASKVVPSDPYATPILSTVGILLDAVKTASTVRKQVAEELKGLIPIFLDVELFLGTFPDQENIHRASVDLAIVTMDSIERAVGFFLRNAMNKAVSALVKGGNYETELLQSLKMVKDRSRILMKEGLKSHIKHSEIYSKETQIMHWQLNQKMDNTADRLNVIEGLLRDHVTAKEEVEKCKEENKHLRIEIERMRSASPSPTALWLAPPPQRQALALEWYISQDTLQRVVDLPDLELVDLSFVVDKKMQLPAKQRLRAEQVVSTQLFRDWIVSPFSDKLLVQWNSDRPKTIADISPLSILCATLEQSLRTKQHFIRLIWFCGRHVNPAELGEHTGAVDMVASLINQLLGQHSFDMCALHHEFDLQGVQRRSLDALLNLLTSLVRQLPWNRTVVCIFDGVVLFERPELQNDALQAFGSLLGLAADSSLSVTIKILFTSVPAPDIMRVAFESGGRVLSVDKLPQLPWSPNDERLARQLEGNFSESPQF